MEYMATAQGQAEKSLYGGPALFYMQRGDDKVSADCICQIEGQVESRNRVSLLTYSKAEVSFFKLAGWKVYCRPTSWSN